MRDERAREGPTEDCCRSVSAMAIDVTGQLQLLRDLRTRAWRAGRRHVDRMPASSKSDPLLALDERTPLISVTQRRCSGPGRSARPLTLPSPLEGERGCRTPSPRLRGEGWGEGSQDRAGLLCLWRTQAGLGRAPSSVLIATHIACEVPRFVDRAAVAAFVTSTIERCRARIQPLIDRERIVARDRLDAAERARTMRLARRDHAIEASMVATLRTRAAVSGWLQPLLFDDIASEKTTMAGA
jgi:hypothetical protein